MGFRVSLVADADFGAHQIFTILRAVFIFRAGKVLGDKFVEGLRGLGSLDGSWLESMIVYPAFGALEIKISLCF